VGAVDGKVAIMTGGQRRWATNGATANSRIEEHESRAMTTEALYTDTALHAWKLIIARLDQMFSSMNDEELLREVAPGRNRVFYLIGHLTAVHDRLLPLLGLGERLHPELDDDFVTNADRVTADHVAPEAVRLAWSEVNARLTAAMAALPPEEWLKKHNAVSDEDFAKDPLRNRLSVLQTRTTHAGFHAGQIRLALTKG
jgi:DinB superfamily